MRLLIEARPGAGKTTAAVRLAERLRRAGLPVAGFVTEEIREGRSRVGFRVETFSGERGVLAHVDLAGPPRVGKYGVDLEAFERTALPALEPNGGAATVIDELGKMELARSASGRPSPSSSKRTFRWLRRSMPSATRSPTS